MRKDRDHDAIDRAPVSSFVPAPGSRQGCGKTADHVSAGAMSVSVQSAAAGTTQPRSTLGTATRLGAATGDLMAASSLWRLCWTLAWLDIKLRYRGSILGPFWLTLSTAIMVGAMGSLYAGLFKMNLHEYLPYLVLSLVLWGFLSGLVGDACLSYTSSENLIRSVRMPFTLYGARIVVRNVLVLGHNVVVVVAVMAMFGVVPGVSGLLAIPGFALWLIDSFALCLLLGALCARFRDIPPIIGSILQIAFFVTPVLWKPELISAQRQWILPFNPFYSLMEMIRAPLLGAVPPMNVFVSAVIYSVLMCVGAWLVFARVRGRIAFWL
jgi:lipopolysaccharide transport system permease protein